MRCALIDFDGSVAAVLDIESPDMWSHPDDMEVVDATGFEPNPSYLPSDYVYSDGRFALDASRVSEREASRQYEPSEALGTLLAVSNLTASVPDADALKMRGFLPPFDPARQYSEGELVVRYGKVCRRTSMGWREIG